MATLPAEPSRERRVVVHRVPPRRLQPLQPVPRQEVLVEVTEEAPIAEDSARR